MTPHEAEYEEYEAKRKAATRRDLFAAAALTGLLAFGSRVDVYLPRDAVRAADLLLKELDK